GRRGTWNSTTHVADIFKTTFPHINSKRRSTRSTTCSQNWHFACSFSIDHHCRRSTKTGLKMVDLWWMWWMSKQARCSAPAAEFCVEDGGGNVAFVSLRYRRSGSRGPASTLLYDPEVISDPVGWITARVGKVAVNT